MVSDSKGKVASVIRRKVGKIRHVSAIIGTPKHHRFFREVSKIAHLALSNIYSKLNIHRTKCPCWISGRGICFNVLKWHYSKMPQHINLEGAYKMKTIETIAICNRGVGKTSSTVNFGVGLALRGKKVLLVDAFPNHTLYPLRSVTACDSNTFPASSVRAFRGHGYYILRLVRNVLEIQGYIL